MGLLVMLCSRYDYVEHFHHEKDVNYVMAKVQDLLSLDNERKKAGVLLSLCDGQTFENLIYHLAVHLRVILYLSLRL